jgi:hypothetical protein
LHKNTGISSGSVFLSTGLVITFVTALIDFSRKTLLIAESP